MLLLDTYDTAAAAHLAVQVTRELAAEGHRLAGVRLDSGDLAATSRDVRAILDAGGCPEVRIIVSGGLDEHDVAALLAAGAPIDAFGIGTRLDVSADAPSLGGLMSSRWTGHAITSLFKTSSTVMFGSASWAHGWPTAFRLFLTATRAMSSFLTPYTVM